MKEHVRWVVWSLVSFGPAVALALIPVGKPELVVVAVLLLPSISGYCLFEALFSWLEHKCFSTSYAGVFNLPSTKFTNKLLGLQNFYEVMIGNNKNKSDDKKKSHKIPDPINCRCNWPAD